MKIVHFSSEYPPQQVFGLGRFVHDLAVAQAAAGDEVHVVTNSLRGEDHDVIRDGVHVHRVSFPPPPKPHLSTVVVTQFNVQVLGRAAPIVRSVRPDVLNLHDWLTVPAGLPLADVYDLPLVFTVHDTVNGKRRDPKCDDPYAKLSAEDVYVAKLERWGAAHADRVICCSRFVLDELTDVYEAPADRIRVVPCGVDARTFEVDATADHLAAFRTVLAQRDEPLVVYLGRLDPEKGLHVLMNAVPKILRAHPRTRFVVVGKGLRQASLEQHVAEAGLASRFLFPGYVSGQPLAQLLSVADVLVVPSTYEPFGIVALEGMVNRLPVVVPDTTGLAEIVEHDVDGLQFETGVAHALAAAVNRLLGDEELCARLGEAGRAKALARYNWAGIAARTRDVYEEAIGAGPVNRYPAEPIRWATAAPTAAPSTPRTPHQHTAVLVVVRDRLALTRQCLDALHTHTHSSFDLVVIDAGSAPDTLRYLADQLHAGRIARLVCNAPGTLPQWQKGAAIAQAVHLLTDEHFTHFAWVDNDVLVEPGWLTAGLDVLEQLPSELPVLSLCSGDAEQRRVHPTDERLAVGDHDVRISPSANGALWLVARSFFGRFGLPPIGAGITQPGVEDWHYTMKLREAGCRFALLDGFACHRGEGHSMRELAYERP